MTDAQEQQHAAWFGLALQGDAEAYERCLVGLAVELRAYVRGRGPAVGGLTINGKAELVVQDAAAYQALLDRVEAIEGERGLADVKAGRTKPASQVFARLRRTHGIPR